MGLLAPLNCNQTVILITYQVLVLSYQIPDKMYADSALAESNPCDKTIAQFFS